MHAVLTAFGASPPEALDHLELRDQAFPTDLDPTDVVVRVRAADVNWVDLIMMSGQYQHLLQPPWTPGLQFAGEVVQVGEAVDTWQVGDRVLADGLKTGPRSHGRHQRSGGFATWAPVPADALMRVPDGWSFAEAATFYGAYETAWHVLHTGGVSAGETLLVHGASGSTGLAAVHLAKRLGATVIATGRTASKLDVVRAQGADHVICLADGGRFRDQVKELTDGRGADVVYDGVGGAVTLESLRAVRFGARLLVVGWASTPDVADAKGRRGAPRANVLPTNLVLMKGLHVIGCPMAIATHRDPSIRAERLAALDQAIGEGLRPHVGASFPLEQVHDALRAKWRSQAVGGTVVTMADDG